MCSFRYYFIDFGISTRFEGPGPHLVTGTIGRDPTPPELSATVPYDPFKLDVYLLGNHFLRAYVEVRLLPCHVLPPDASQKCTNLEFLRPLLLHMTRRNPDARPTAEQALRLLRREARKPYGVPFRWRLRRRDDGLVRSVILDVHSVFREVYFQLRHILLRTNEISFGRPPP